jgi:AraC family transcriptional regulator
MRGAYRGYIRHRQEREVKGNHRSSIVSIHRQATVQWPGLTAVYSWLPPHEAVGVAKRNQVEIVFAAHSNIEASSLAHLLARRLLVTYRGIELPDAALPGSKLSETAIRMVRDFIEANLGTRITLEDLAALVHLSPFHFARCFKATIGLAPHQYVIARRMELAKRLLLTTTLNVSEIAWSIGYQNISHFRRLFTMHIGVRPGIIRRAAGIQPRA